MPLQYRRVTTEEAIQGQYPDHEQLGESSLFWSAVYQFEDGKPTRLVGMDGGEPEDQSLIRDWSWVTTALQEAYLRGRIDSTMSRIRQALKPGEEQPLVFEAVPEEQLEDSGRALIFTVDGPPDGATFARVQSWDVTGQHLELKPLSGQLLRVSVEVVR